MAADAHLDPSRFFTTDPQGGALLDRNSDGFPDGLRAHLVIDGEPATEDRIELIHLAARLGLETGGLDLPLAVPAAQDRKSTRLNSSHANISYAVFCLKKKKTQTCY